MPIQLLSHQTLLLRTGKKHCCERSILRPEARLSGPKPPGLLLI
ncbi:hypothetical protein ES319_A12G051600v1 [Gossypium barbadense]|uniref:Uncharacterized protein n=2 Tax=Gossypium TaxID=3633 RepID=A0A5J5T6L3_GOSBA|nr:hypothetical protein ES319_A12G051600v1 [Gossypium barbadense]TYG88855.1 hypothetical protein ES288_A12G054300v1 [Gossypium darwinii]